MTETQTAVARERNGLRAPTISVVIPSYNYSSFIPDALDSVLQQGDLDAQIVVQDGGSNDGTVDILRSYGDRVQVVSAPDDGQSDALNKAIARAEGDWIAWLNADEFYFPGALQALLAEGERTGADVVYGDSVDVDSSGKLLRLVPEHPFSRTVLRTYGCFISTVAILLRRRSLGAVPLDPQLRWGIMDWDLFLRLTAEGSRFAYTPFPVGAFRVHGDRITADPDAYAETYPIVRTRHEIRDAAALRKMGRGIHGLMKVTSGAFLRQYKARALKGKGLRWWVDSDDAQTFKRLLRDCYGKAD